MKALLRVLLLLLGAGLWSAIAPAAPTQTAQAGTPDSLQHRGAPDCQGLPKTPGTPEVWRGTGDPNARSGGLQFKPVDWLSGELGGARTVGKCGGAWRVHRAARIALPFQAHLRTNGSADAHGSRA